MPCECWLWGVVRIRELEVSWWRQRMFGGYESKRVDGVQQTGAV